MKKTLFALLILVRFAARLDAAEFHVALTGSDANAGTTDSPLRTIQRAANLAQPGDTITVHSGIYRERINPPRGGDADGRRIVYQAAPGERVEISGAEIVTNWTRVQHDTWKVVLPNSFFGAFNPYRELIQGDWFYPKGRLHHPGAVYLNGDWIWEAAKLDEVLKPSVTKALWFGAVDATNTTIWAQFPGVNPNERRVEINVRQTVFYPQKTGINFLTMRGFILRNAATPWSPPTAEQIGLIGTHWSKGWIIESNQISYSRCSGVTLGKYGDAWDNTSADSAGGYVLTIQRALTNGWNGDIVGHHIVRNNEISHCEQTGICGSLGAIFSTISGNKIHDIYVQRQFAGAEMGGIKFHAAIDCVICGNHVYRAYRGLWLDWMAQGTRLTRNVFLDNSAEDVYTEVNHGPFVVDNNIFLSPVNLWDMSEGGAYAHNLFAGIIISQPERGRFTPFHLPHSVVIAGLTNIAGGDHRFYNNLFVGDGGTGSESNPPKPEAKQKGSNHTPRGAGFGLIAYDVRDVPIYAGGNVYLHGAKPWKNETNAIINAAFDPGVKLIQQGESAFLEMNFADLPTASSARPVTTALLGKARISNADYENADGTPLTMDKDFLGETRDDQNLTAGPFASPQLRKLKLP